MHRLPRRSLGILALLVATTLVAAGCGSDAADTDSAGSDAAGSEGDGNLLVSGSSTVFPIVNAQAVAFGTANPGVAIAVEGPGTGDGAQKFCSGEAPLANASRLYKEEELAACTDNGIEYIEIRRGIDGISVITSADNDAIECLSFNQLYALIGDESMGFENWSDANELLVEMGSTAGELPDAALDIFGPGEESGTFDSFTEIVIDGVAGGKTGLDTDAHEFADVIRLDYNSSPDDNVIIEGIGGSQYSLGWVGYAFAKEAEAAGTAHLLAVSKEDGGECVTPSPETIASAEFPIARYLYTYVNADAAANEPAVAAFVDYMMSDVGLESVSAEGYVDLSDADQTKAQAIWADRTTGSQW